MTFFKILYLTIREKRGKKSHSQFHIFTSLGYSLYSTFVASYQSP